MRETLLPRDPVTRALTLATMAASLATGLFYSVSALYFTRVVGLIATTVGVGLTVAGARGVVASYAAGRASDALGADRVQVGAMLVQGLALLAYGFVSGVGAFAAVACIAVALRSAQATARQALLARWFTGPERVGVRARLRVVTNVFIGLGTVLASVALLLGTAAAYRVTMLLTGALVLLAVVPLVRLGRAVPELAGRVRAPRRDQEPGAGGRSPLRDPTYLAATGLSAVLAMQFGLQTVGLPLWVAGHTDAPTVVISGLMVINTVLVALLQIPAARGTHDVRLAGRAVRRAGVLLAVSCALFAAAAYGDATTAVVVLLLGAVVAAGGEVLSEAGGWGLAFELADPHSAGAYQGVSQTGYAVATMLAPLVVTVTAIEHGTAGWAVLGGVFVTAGVATALVAGRAARWLDGMVAAGEARSG